MRGFLITSILLFVAGVIFFGLAANCYSTILNLQELLGYYGIQSDNLTSGNAMETFAQLRFGIIKFSILGLVAWVLGLIFFVKRNNKLSYK